MIGMSLILPLSKAAPFAPGGDPPVTWHSPDVWSARRLDSRPVYRLAIDDHQLSLGQGFDGLHPFPKTAFRPGPSRAAKTCPNVSWEGNPPGSSRNLRNYISLESPIFSIATDHRQYGQNQDIPLFLAPGAVYTGIFQLRQTGIQRRGIDVGHD